MRSTLSAKGGFTLVEMMVAMALTGIVIAGVYKTFDGQQRVYNAQDQAVDMQQTLRGAMDFMSREIRMAGMDPTGTAEATIRSASSNSISFTLDLIPDGGTADGVATGNENEDIEYTLSNHMIVRKSPSTSVSPQYFENIEGIEFFYTLNNGTQTTAPAASDVGRIRSVVITILAKSDKEEKSYTDTNTYTAAGGTTWGPFGDKYHRRLLQTSVRCHNMDFKL